MRNDDDDDPLGFDLFNGDPPMIDAHDLRLPRSRTIDVALTIILGAIITVTILGAIFR